MMADGRLNLRWVSLCYTPGVVCPLAALSDETAIYYSTFF